MIGAVHAARPAEPELQDSFIIVVSARKTSVFYSTQVQRKVTVIS